LIISPYFNLDAIFNWGQTTGVTAPDTPSTEGFRGQLEANVDFTTPSGLRLELGASYDGLFRSEHKAWGATIGLEIPLASVAGGATVNLGITFDGPLHSEHEVWGATVGLDLPLN